jgi:hypothetical protein
VEGAGERAIERAGDCCNEVMLCQLRLFWVHGVLETVGLETNTGLAEVCLAALATSWLQPNCVS